MPDYSIIKAPLQEHFIKFDDGHVTRTIINTITGKQVETLHDEKWDWKERKKQTLKLSDLYDAGHNNTYAEKLKTCSTWLEYLAPADRSDRELYHYNACKKRLCPICNARKARIMAMRLMRILKQVKIDHPDTQLLFLTLTLKNCQADDLRATLDLLTRAWKKMIDRKPIQRAVKGWFRAIEITYNQHGDNYHPHIHAILVVEDGYFKRTNGLYLTQADWARMWQESLKVNYKPVVSIQRANGKRGDKGLSAAVEAAKYATKGSDYLSRNLPKHRQAEVVETYTSALHRKRLTAMGGWVKAAAQQLAVDMDDAGDLVHDEDGNGKLTPETADLIEFYGWHFGIAEHVLTGVTANPNKPAGCDDDSVNNTAYEED